MKTITLRDVFAAMRKNGYPKAIGRYRVRGYKTNKVIEACAVGQAAINLKVDPSDLSAALNSRLLGDKYIASEIFILNDNTKLTVPEIADRLESKYSKYLDLELNKIYFHENKIGVIK